MRMKSLSIIIAAALLASPCTHAAFAANDKPGEVFKIGAEAETSKKEEIKKEEIKKEEPKPAADKDLKVEPVVIGGDRKEDAKPAEKQPEKQSEKQPEPKNDDKKPSEQAPVNQSGLSAPEIESASYENKKVELKIKKVPNALVYFVYRSASEKAPEIKSNEELKQLSAADDVNYTDSSDIEEGKTYYYYAIAAMKDKEDRAKYVWSQPSKPAKVTTRDTSAPDTPSNFEASLKNDKAALKWDAAKCGDFKAYVIKKGRSADALAPLKTITDQAAAEYVDNEFDPDKESFYSIEVVDKTDNVSKPSAVKSVKIVDSTPPAVPYEFSAEARNEKVVLKWDANSEKDFGAYTIRRGLKKDALTEIKKITNISETEYIDSGCEPGTENYYTISAADKKGNESAQSKARMVVPEDKNPPDVPAGLAVKKAENGEITVSWDTVKSRNFGHYMVLNGRMGLQDAVETKCENTEFTLKGVEDGKTYYIAVASVSRFGVKSNPCAVLRVISKDTIPPSAPSGLKLKRKSSGVEISWDAVNDKSLDCYAVYRCEKGGSPEKLKGADSVKGTSFIDKNVKTGKEYSYCVTAGDRSMNESRKSSEASIKVKSNLTVSFARSGGSSFYCFAYNPEKSSLYYAESGDGKSWKWWTCLQENFPMPDNFNDACHVSFVKDGAKMAAIVYDVEKAVVMISVSADSGKTWKWWSEYSSQAPQPDEYNENCVFSFTLKGASLNCICFDRAKKSVLYASTPDGKTWKWWKKAAENIAVLSNLADETAVSSTIYGNDLDVYTYNVEKESVQKVAVPLREGLNSASWMELCNLPKPPNAE